MRPLTTGGDVPAPRAAADTGRGRPVDAPVPAAPRRDATAPPGHAAQDPSAQDPSVARPDPVARGEAAAADLAALAAATPGTPRHGELRDRIVHTHLPLVRHLARRYADRGEPLDDLVQVGTIGLLKAVDRYDPDRGTPFAAFAVPTVLGEIRRHFRDRGWAVRVPRRLQEMGRALSGARSALTQELGRAPTVAELAARLGTDEDSVLEALESAGAYATVPLERPGADEPGPAETLGEDDAALATVEDREALRPLLAGLPPRERRILALRFVRGLTQAQIAEEVGISQMHVSRLLARTLAVLRRELDDAT